MSTNSSNEAGKDAIKGGIFFGSNLTPTGTFENIPQFISSVDYTTSTEPRITMTLAKLKEQLQADAKVKNESSSDVLSDTSINAFLTTYVQLLIDYKDLRNFIFFGSSYVEMKFQINYLIDNYPFKSFVARDIVDPLIELINYTEPGIGAQTDILFTFDDIQQVADYYFDVTGKTLWPDFEVQDVNGDRHPIVLFNNSISADIINVTGVGGTIEFKRTIGGIDYGVETLETGMVLTFVDNTTGDIKATGEIFTITPGPTSTICDISPLVFEGGYTTLAASDYVVFPPSLCSITIEGTFTINDFVLWYKTSTDHFKGFVISPKIQTLIDFEVSLDGIKRLLLDALNPVPWPREPITNNLIITGDDYDDWLLDPNNLVLNYTQDKDGLSSEPDSDFNMVSAWTMDENATNQLLMRCIPHRLVDEINDIDDRYFTRFIWLAAKLFDTIKLYIDFLKYTHTLNYSNFNHLSPEFYKQYAEHYGFDLLGEDNIDFSKTLIFTEPGLAYSNGTDPVYTDELSSKTLKDLQYERQKRLLINLFYLYQKKGTIQCIEYLANLIGSPRGLVLVEEYSLDMAFKRKVVDNIKIHVPTYSYIPDPAYAGVTPIIYKLELSNEGQENLREISINIDILNAILEDILKYGEIVYPYGFLGEKTFANLQNPDENYYFLPLTFPDKFSGVTFSYNIPRNGLRHGWGNNDSEVTFNMASVYNVKPLLLDLHINSIVVNAIDPTKTDIAVDLLTTHPTSYILVTGATEKMPDGNKAIDSIVDTVNETIITVNVDTSATGAYLNLGFVVGLVPNIINKTEKFNYKIPPIFLDPTEDHTTPLVDELITYKAIASFSVSSSMDLTARNGYAGSIEVVENNFPINTTTTISLGWIWDQALTVEQNVIKIVDSINRCITAPNFVATYNRTQTGCLIVIQFDYTTTLGAQPYSINTTIDDGSGPATDIELNPNPSSFTTYIPSTESVEYIIARLEGKDLVVRLKVVSEDTVPVPPIERVAIFEDLFDNDGLNHFVKLIYRPEGVEVYKDYKYLGLARWLALPIYVFPFVGWTARNIPKVLFPTLTITPLPNSLYSYPSDTVDISIPSTDVTDWWDVFIGYGTAIEVYMNKVSVFENLYISQPDYIDNGLGDNGYELEKWAFNFVDQIKDVNGVFITDRISVPCTYRAPNPTPYLADPVDATVIDVFFSNDTSKINLTSKTFYGGKVEFVQSVADFFIVPADEIYSIDTLFKYNAHSPTLHTDYTYQNFDRVYDNYYTFAQQVLTYYNLNTFIELIEQKFQPLIAQFIPIVINICSFGKTLKNNTAKVRYPNAHFNCYGYYKESHALANFRVTYGINGTAFDIKLKSIKKDVILAVNALTLVLETADENGFLLGDFVTLDGFSGTASGWAGLNGSTFPIVQIFDTYKFRVGVAVGGTWIPTGNETITKSNVTLFSGTWNASNIITAQAIATSINAAFPGGEIFATATGNVVSLEADVLGYWNLTGQNINEETIVFNLAAPVGIDNIQQFHGGHIGTVGNECITIEYKPKQVINPTTGLFIFYDEEAQMPLYIYYDVEGQPPLYI